MKPSTPLPWSVDEAEVRSSYGAVIIAADGDSVARVHGFCKDETTLDEKKASAEADARFIVTACNAHADLVGALMAARAVLEMVGADVSSIDASLAKVGVP